MPAHGDGGPAELAGLTRAWMKLVGVAQLVLSPLGWVFRIREGLPVVLRAVLPLVFLAIIGLCWQRATTGEYYLARLSTLSPLDAQRKEIEKVTRCPVKLGTREKKSWSSKEVQLEINEVTLPKPSYDARKDEIAKLGQFDVVLPAAESGPVGEVTLKARFTSFFGERIPAKSGQTSEATKQRTLLDSVLPKGSTVQLREVPQGSDTMVIDHLIVPADVAPLTTLRAALDAIAGQGGWVATAGKDGTLVTGTERKEERRIPVTILPSPREMLDAIPSAINQRWSSWSDARAWWNGTEVVKPRFEGPKPIDRHELFDIPFAVADGFLYARLGANWTDWLLFQAVLWSTLRIVLGFLVAAALAIPLGVLMGSFGKPRAFFEPVRLMGSYLPLPAFVALTLAWCGTTEAQKVCFLAIASFVVLLPQVIMAVEGVPQAHLLSAETLGATRLQQMRYVLYAGARAEIFRALRLTFAVGWTWVTLAESVDPKAGLGYVMFLGERRAEHRPHIYVVIVLIVALAFLVNTAWAWVERKLYPYREAMSE
jgi:NitT/TauT family transport system permease protein